MEWKDTVIECAGSFQESLCEEGAIQLGNASKALCVQEGHQDQSNFLLFLAHPICRSWGSHGHNAEGLGTRFWPGKEEPQSISQPSDGARHILAMPLVLLYAQVSSLKVSVYVGERAAAIAQACYSIDEDLACRSEQVQKATYNLLKRKAFSNALQN
eukprot:1155833-Pelagomonas_calceolata.AAC.3